VIQQREHAQVVALSLLDRRVIGAPSLVMTCLQLGSVSGNQPGGGNQR
jgi:hypothetical protein